MKKLAVFVLIVIFSEPLFAQLDSALCSQFKTGLFAYRDDSSNAILMKRTARRQEERIKKSGIVTKFKIRWLGACSYELTQVWSNRRTGRKNNGSTTIVNITAVKKDQYEYSCACKEPDVANKSRGIMYRIE